MALRQTKNAILRHEAEHNEMNLDLRRKFNNFVRGGHSDDEVFSAIQKDDVAKLRLLINGTRAFLNMQWAIDHAIRQLAPECLNYFN